MLVLGLGNPGRRYERTRHNAGFLVVDRVAERWGEPVAKKQLGALVGKARLGDETVALAKPQSFMNLSGQPAASLKGFYKVETEAIVVVHDDVDLPFGTVRLKRGGGHGGHNGLRDLSTHLGPSFVRVRVGVSRPPEGWDTADYVLGKWTTDEESVLDELVGRAAEAVHVIATEGLPQAMQVFNAKKSPPVGDA